MNIFGFNLTFTQSSPVPEEPRSFAAQPDSPPSYVSLYPQDIGPVSHQVGLIASDTKFRPARPFPADWQVSVGPQNSVLRGAPRADENVGRRT
ncbi:hypothetical protein CROQUDRAFT_96341 [Cronartium quercuum f. sp. fusiforme G11]|uniref:Uncharacterized protein n=1 Tax=Cronartium quercuum f. sp. fusiforme G11 TaxID=708437 RepID=A0A9P6NGU6_9BASI|nr:hypothetical protein CROQUDRAFT_96341 [Cronartium quercuum f. sp. fusiforme G11]